MENNKNKALTLIEEAATVAAKSFGLCIWGIELLNQNGHFMARIYVDTDQNLSLTQNSEDTPEDFATQGGVTIAQCTEISRMIGLALDVEDIFVDAWVLEVSSPGFDRKFFELDHMRAYIGHTIEVVLESPLEHFNMRRKFRGQLQKVEQEDFTLNLESPKDEQCTLDWSNIRKAHLVHIFPETSSPKKRVKA